MRSNSILELRCVRVVDACRAFVATVFVVISCPSLMLLYVLILSDRIDYHAAELLSLICSAALRYMTDKWHDDLKNLAQGLAVWWSYEHSVDSRFQVPAAP